MTCEECQDLLPLYLAGGLDAAETADVRQHLTRAGGAGCPACAGVLAQTEATLHQVPLGLPLVEAPAGAWDKLETRIALKEQLAPSAEDDRMALDKAFTNGAKPAARMTAWSALTAAALLAVALGATLTFLANERKVNSQSAAIISDAVNKAQDAQSRLAGLEQQLKNLNKDYALQQARYDQLIRSDSYALSGAGADQPDVHGKILVDRVENSVTLIAENVKAPPQGKAYELWIIPPDGKPLATPGTQVPDASGKLVLQAPIPQGVQLATAAVTIEDPAGSPTPTSPVQFAGKAMQ